MGKIQSGLTTYSNDAASRRGLKLTPGEAKLLHGCRRHWRDWKIRVEAVFGLMWTVVLAGQMDFRKTCPDGLVHSFPDLHVVEPAAEWRSRAELRGVGELLLTRDLV